MNQITTNRDIINILRKNETGYINVGLNPHKLNQFVNLAKIDLLKILPKFKKEEWVKVAEEYIPLLNILARFNLMPDPINQKAYILPFSKDKTKRLSLQIGYKAYVEFAVKSGYSLNTQIIYSNDDYDINLGTNTINHKPSLTNRGTPIAVYTIAKKRGEVTIEIMNAEDIKTIKGLAYIGEDSPWNKFEGEMWKKTCLKRCIKRLDLTGTELELVDMVDNQLGYEPKPIEVVNDFLDEIKKPDSNNQLQKQQQNQEIQEIQENEGEF